jgi:S1-C subfamily serine protease
MPALFLIVSLLGCLGFHAFIVFHGTSGGRFEDSSRRRLAMAFKLTPPSIGPALMKAKISSKKFVATASIAVGTVLPQCQYYKREKVHSQMSRIEKLQPRPFKSLEKLVGNTLKEPSAKQIARGQLGSSFVRDSVNLVGPSVVRVDCERTMHSMMGIFQDIETAKVSGSGFIVSSDGYMLTNAHVVDGTSRITVSLASGRTYRADLVALDELTDLALLKADVGKEKLPVAPMGDSTTLQSGDWVIAVGCPVGLDFTVTLGIVSNPKRSAFEVGAPHMKGAFIQTDAALNQGNSGGPLVNENGDVVGINTMVRTNTEAIGFAIPINSAQQIYKVLRQGTKPTHAYFGVEAMSTTPDTARIHNDDPNVQRLAPVHGALVMRVVPGSPAAQAGLRKNDILRSVDGQKVTNAEDADALLDACTPGSPAKIRVARGENGNEVDLNATPLNLLSVIEERRQRMSGSSLERRPTPQNAYPEPPGRGNGRGGNGRG